MGYRIRQQLPWGAAELIEVAPPQPIAPAGASAGGDSAEPDTLRPGFIYGANDPRRPGGVAIGY